LYGNFVGLAVSFLRAPAVRALNRFLYENYTNFYGVDQMAVVGNGALRGEDDVHVHVVREGVRGRACRDERAGDVDARVDDAGDGATGGFRHGRCS
jgi:hypothetical protein